MHHLYPSLKGDQLCPLGFHPQTRYPTRCKRCFRDYKEHGGRRGIDDIAASSPNLSDAQSARPSSRNWTSTQNLLSTNGNSDIELKKRPQSWASTPDIDEADDPTKGNQRVAGRPMENNVDVTVRLPTPTRRHTTNLDIKEVEDSLSSSSPKSSSSPSRNIPDDLVILSTDSLAERARKMNLLKKQRSLSRERSVPKKSDDESESKPPQPPDRPERSKSSSSLSAASLSSEQKRLSLPPKKTPSSVSSSPSASPSTASASNTFNDLTSRPASIATSAPAMNSIAKVSNSNSPTIKTTTLNSNTSRKEWEYEKKPEEIKPVLKPKKYDSSVKTSSKTTPNATNDQNLTEELTKLRTDYDAMRSRAERAEREKSDILLRRLASMDTAPNRTAASEALMLQQKVNELKEQLDKVSEDKRRLNQRMKEMEGNPKNGEYELKRKLQAAEQLCEELMDENQDAKKEILNLQAEMDELQDTFRDDEIKAKTSIQKELEKATKNCRILSFKLKKSERRIETLEQERESTSSVELSTKVKKLEEELRFTNEMMRKLQSEAEELRNPGKKRTPMLGVLGKSTSADAKFTRESLTRGGSQEDPQQLLRDLQDSVERESDLRDQLKFSEEEAENLRKKVARFEDENDSLMMQLKKMATRNSRTRKLSPTPRRLAPEVQAERDEGISDEDDPAELRILLELNEQEASILRMKADDLEKENNDAKKQIRDLQEKLRNDSASKKSSLLSFGSSSSDKQLKTLNEELARLRKTILEKDRQIEHLQADAKAKAGQIVDIDAKRQLNLVEHEAAILRVKITTLESENEKLLKETKKLQLQVMRKASSTEKNNGEVDKLKESLNLVERERDELNSKLKRILQEADEKLSVRSPKRVTDLTPKNHLKRWVEELEDEITEMRAIVLHSGGDKLKTIENEKTALDEELQRTKQKLALAESELQKLKSSVNSSAKASELEQKLKKSEEESKKLNTKLKDLEDKLKKQDNQIKLSESVKATLEAQVKRDKEKMTNLEKDYEKERKEREKLESKIAQIDAELANSRKSSEKTKTSLEKEIKELKAKSSKSDSKQVQELKKQVEELQTTLREETKRYDELNSHWEKLSEETILMRAQLTTEKENLKADLNSMHHKISDMETLRVEKTQLAKRLSEAQKRVTELEAKTIANNTTDYEKSRLKNKLADKEQEYDRLKRENEMNIDLVFQLRKDNEDLNSKLSDFNRIEQAQSSINGHSAALQTEIKNLKSKLESSELQMKSEVATVRLRYEQQVKNLSAELTSMQRQCEKFKKDRDAFKQMLESAQKKIGDLKANATGRQSRTSMHSSDDDDKSKIAYLEQQIGSLEDQLVEARLEANKVKTELVSERSANEIKIAEMQSKLNEVEEDRVIGSGRTKIPGMKTKLELSWQKEREDQQRLLQETSTLARDLRQTLFEVERERDKERLESKRRLDQLKRATEEELEEGRRKVAELQCDLLELRDVHAKLRTSNEKLRRERERYEKELVKRRIEQDGGDRKVGALLQTVDELVKIAPDLTVSNTVKTGNNTLRAEQANTRRSPSPGLSSTQISTVLARLAEASEELRKFQRMSEEETERYRMRRSNLRRAASQENDPHGSTSSVASAADSHRGVKISRSRNGSMIRKSLSLDQHMQHDQNIWRQDDGSVSSMQSIDSELGGLVRDSSIDSRLDSRLSGGSTQSDIPRGARKKKKGFMGKLRSLTKSGRNSESEVSIQGSDSDISVASDMRGSKKDLRNRLSGMFKRSGSTSRSNSTERFGTEQRPVAVTIVGAPDGPKPRDPPAAGSVTPKPIRSIPKPPTPTPQTPVTKRRAAK